ncbi:MAG TPA: methylenetetrahydrofolate reductase, partial [Bacteroidia bacterium]|nr:methylenetetrahydrofolate reductase [Bacteroidia bacterium]
AGYPEKHFEAPNMSSDLKWLKAKVEAGAEHIVTQMFFDNAKYFEFVDMCKQNGINVPIIPGLKILSSKAQIKSLPKIFKIDIPHHFYEALEKCKDDKEVKEVGVQWCIQQCKELMKANVPCIHFYTMGASETTRKVAKEIF